ncbi:phosphatidylinositol synthase 1 (CDP-alcohol phosphatidyltransferase1) [Yamadazyma tenuis]|uniref:CDP-diacylglycerol--inositol 3-phosphatidyltransferase n=1 Tax=Candida tenuis (strain ATCC 10573 / BCRC 21748 / CBS 615 / JCM 9827 / NBRC 10315 / NRRL Y-1498 / VKM Y-70) TaxID=590646 RepID=G3BAK5_CANTC|nr:CDP-diacylglycerol--inositol 3-phosphatidyltransferase [Yamadazyma tenuis ATCC 10573]EGV61428.1 CDP-diacylglycerol--inositol 3-phosphatidyltransferase [Yamadazyma tenuis ATCC 10573]WEJ92645.1 phosphatidylinositol synthase 1 (CDP-alcohol phosphatidyltransferase1) [Yamadazyma tenuis]
MSSNSKSSTTVSIKDVFFFIPNLIGYFRVLTAIASFVTMKNHPYYTFILYGISGFLDAFDGYAARKYNQGTRYGAVLDMVTDRCATSSLICYLCVIYPQYCFIWQLLVSLDLASHYMHMYAMMSTGSASHKNVGKEQSRILSLYYTNRKVLFVVCLVNELFYVALYLHSFQFFWLGTVLAWLSVPIWAFKQFANLVQLKAAAIILASMDAAEKSKPKNA